MAEKKVIELEVKSNLGSLKSQLREAQNDVNALSEKFGATSQEAINAAKRAAQLKDAIGDAKALTDAFNPDAKFNALSSSIGGVLNGFQAFEGALGLVGVEGEAVQETLLKVQSAMALSQGIQELAEARDSFKQLGAVIGDTFKGLKGALLASGIGAFVVLLGVVASEWDNIAESLGLVNKKQEAYNDTLEDYKKGATEAIVSTQKVKSAFDLAKDGVISKEEALQTYNDTLGDSFGKATSLTQAEELYNSKADAYVQAMAKRARATAFFQKSAELATEAITSSQEDQTSFFDKVGVAFKSFGKSYEQTNKELLVIQQKRSKENAKKKNEEAKFFEDLAILETKGAENLENAVGIKSEAEIKLENDRKQRAEAQKQRADEELKQVKDYIREARKFNEDSAKTEQQKELDDISIKYKLQIDLAKKYNQDITELVTAQKQEENAINLKYDSERLAQEEVFNKMLADAEKQRLIDIADQQEEFDTAYYEATASKQQLEIDAVNEKYFTLIEKAKEYGYDTVELERKQAEEIDAIRKTSTDKELANQQALRDARVNIATQGLTLISDLSELFAKKDEKSARRNFNIQKAVSLAQAGISAFQGVQNAFTTASASPITALNPAYPFIQAGLAGAFGAVNIAKIAKTKYEGGTPSLSGGGGGSGADGGGTTVNAPNFNVVGNNGQNQLAQLSQQPIQAYVVSGEVTSAQALDRNRIQNATL